MKIWIVLLTVVCACLAVAVSWLYIKTPKIGFVHSYELIYQYEGMIEAQNTFKAISDVMAANTDTLIGQYQMGLQRYTELEKTYSNKQLDSARMELNRQKENITKYKSITDERIVKEEKEMLDGISNQVNAVIFSYGEKHGFDLIFGSGDSGILLYGKETVDITEDILEVLNNEYYKKNEK